MNSDITYGPQSITYTNDDGSVHRRSFHWCFGDRQTRFDVARLNPAEPLCLMLVARHFANGNAPEKSWVANQPSPDSVDLELCFASEQSLDVLINVLTTLKQQYVEMSTPQKSH